METKFHFNKGINMNDLSSPMQIPRYLKWLKALTLLVSGLLTLWVLIVFWSWLGPATFWQKVAGFLLSIGGGLVLFFMIQVFLMMLLGIILSGYVKKRMMVQLGNQGMGPEMPAEPEEELEEDNNGSASEDTESDETMYQ